MLYDTLFPRRTIKATMVLIFAIVLLLITALVLALSDTLAAALLSHSPLSIWVGFGEQSRSLGPISFRKVPLFIRTNRALTYKDTLRRVVVALLGGIVLSTVFTFIAVSSSPTPTPSLTVRSVAQGSPASTGDILPGDRIIAISGTQVKTFAGLQPAITSSKGALTIEYIRAGKPAAVSVPANPAFPLAGITPVATTSTSNSGKDFSHSLAFFLQASARTLASPSKAYSDISALLSNPDTKAFGTAHNLPSTLTLPGHLGTLTAFRTWLLGAYFTTLLSLLFIVLSLVEPVARRRFPLLP